MEVYICCGWIFALKFLLIFYGVGDSIKHLARESAAIDSVKDQSGVDKIFAKKQPYQLLNTNRDFFPYFDASNFHKLVNESS